MFISLTVLIISQSINISKHQIITLNLHNVTSIISKLEKGRYRNGQKHKKKCLTSLSHKGNAN